MVRVVMTGLRLLTVFDFSFCILRFLKIFFSYYSKKSKKGGCFFLCKLLSLALSPWGVVLGVLSLILLKSFSTGIPSFIKVLSFFGSSFLQSLSHSPFLSFLTMIVSRGRGRERMGQTPWAVSPAVKIVAWLEESQSLLKIASESQEISNG